MHRRLEHVQKVEEGEALPLRRNGSSPFFMRTRTEGIRNIRESPDHLQSREKRSMSIKQRKAEPSKVDGNVGLAHQIEQCRVCPSSREMQARPSSGGGWILSLKKRGLSPALASRTTWPIYSVEEAKVCSMTRTVSTRALIISMFIVFHTSTECFNVYM